MGSILQNVSLEMGRLRSKRFRRHSIPIIPGKWSLRQVAARGTTNICDSKNSVENPEPGAKLTVWFLGYFVRVAHDRDWGGKRTTVFFEKRQLSGPDRKFKSSGSGCKPPI
jgi:hypothetical protein